MCHMMNRHLLVVGGNGFVGSAVCKAALAKNWTVSSLSPSGKPFTTPAGHRPGWTENVSWKTGSALHPNSYRALLSLVTDVVVAVGTLFENKHYKQLSTAGSIGDAFQGIRQAFTSPNPLTAPDQSYEALNKNSAVTVLHQFLAANPIEPSFPRTFTFLSAEDFGRPFIPVGYIRSKREAERTITELCHQESTTPVREILVRPGLMYHAHLRPLASPMAVLLDLSATIHGYVPRGIPTPSKLLRVMSSLSLNQPSTTVEPIPPAFESLANMLEIHPMHVDQVARVICESIDNPHIHGVISTRSMRSILADSKTKAMCDENQSKPASGSQINH